MINIITINHLIHLFQRSRIHFSFKKIPEALVRISGIFLCAGGGNRTHTALLPTDFESASSTSSDTPAGIAAVNAKRIVTYMDAKCKRTAFIPRTFSGIPVKSPAWRNNPSVSPGGGSSESFRPPSEEPRRTIVFRCSYTPWRSRAHRYHG